MCTFKQIPVERVFSVAANPAHQNLDCSVKFPTGRSSWIFRGIAHRSQRLMLAAGWCLLLGPLGCSPSRPRRPQLMIMGFDGSGSNRPELAAQAEAGVGVLRRLSPGNDRMYLYRVAWTTDEIASGRLPARRGELRRLLIQEISQRAPRGGTRPAFFWKAAAGCAEQSKLPSEVIFFTDGENDDASTGGREMFRLATQRLAANPRVRRVSVVGVKPEHRVAVRRTMAPLGERLELPSNQELATRSPLFEDQPVLTTSEAGGR